MTQVRPTYRVLVFPSCNEPGLEIVHALAKSNKVQLFGGSSYNLDFDPSRAILQNHSRWPALHSSGFAEEFKGLLAQNEIDTVFPATDDLVAEFSRWRVAGVTFISPNAEAAQLVKSKLQVHRRLEGLVPVPQLFAGRDAVFPAYAKPDCGAGSRGHRIIRNWQEMDAALQENLLVMEYLPGEEYTVDCINDLHGKLLFCGPRLRGQINRGIAVGTRTQAHAQIQDYIQIIAANLRIEGPWFAQFKTSASGHPTLMEINARVGGSMTATRLAGVNIPLMALFLYKGYDIRVPHYETDLVLNRCLTNYVQTDNLKCVLWDLDDTLIRKDGKPDPQAIASLYDCRNRGIKQLLITKNPDVLGVLTHHGIPAFFDEVLFVDDKLANIPAMLERHCVAAQSCIAVNDSNSEKIALEQLVPGLRVITPDALEILGREKA